MITLGQVIAYAIGAGFFHVKSGWRWMVGLGAIPGGIQFLLLFLLPESRTLITHSPVPLISMTLCRCITPQPASSYTKETPLLLEMSCARFTPTLNPKISTSRCPLHFSPNLSQTSIQLTTCLHSTCSGQGPRRSRPTIHPYNPNHDLL